MHIRFTHMHITKIACDICGKPCQSPTEKKLHARSHLNRKERKAEVPVETFLCPECGKILRSAGAISVSTYICIYICSFIFLILNKY